MKTAEIIFWGCLLLIVYAYLLYPVLLFAAHILSQLRRDWRYLNGRVNRRAALLSSAELPPVSLIVPCYNEKTRLPAKIANLQQIAYPSGRLEVIFISDGSDDGTNEILRRLPAENMRAIFLPSRQGKATALNHGVAMAQHEILIFSDAATLFAPGALPNLVRHFTDPRVGVVCGSLRFDGTPESHQTEGVYWRYESMLRLMEGRLGATLTASGAFYSCRRRCCPQLAANTVIDDFVIPMNARKLGYRVLYDPEAVALDFAAPSVADEFTRRVRLAVGSFRSLPELLRTPLMNFTGLAFFSHKLLRWVLPFLLIGLLASNALLWNPPLYRVSLAAQLAFYFWAAVGYLFRQRIQRVRYALVGYFLLAINVAFLVGFVRFLVGREDATWQRVN